MKRRDTMRSKNLITGYARGAIRLRFLDVIDAVDNISRERLDHYLVRTGLASSRRIAQELVERGMVRINGRYPRKSEIVGIEDKVEVKGNDRVEVRGADTRRLATPLQADSSIEINVVHEDPA